MKPLLKIQRNVVNVLDRARTENLHAARSAIGSVGYYLRDRIQTEGGLKGGKDLGWKQLNPHTGILNRAGQGGAFKNYKMVWRGPKGSKVRVRQYYGHRESTRTLPMARLVNAVRYKRQDLGVRIGFLKASMWGLVEKQQAGFSTPVSRKMRRFFFAVGFPLKAETTTLIVPARPLIGKVFEMERHKILPLFRRKYEESWARQRRKAV